MRLIKTSTSTLVRLAFLLVMVIGLHLQAYTQGAGCASYSSATPPPPYDPCVQAVFTADPYCCNTTWDATCAGAYDPAPCAGGGGGCSDCANPTVIGGLPFNMTTTTCGACDNFSSLDACASAYMNGEDYIFAYTPAANETIDLTLTGTLTWTGVFVTDACPTAVGANCVGSNTNSAGNPSMTGVALTGGQTYYITVSTWPTPDCTPFTINIVAQGPTCSDGIQNQGETGVDCGGPCPACGGGCSDCGNPTVVAAVPFNMTTTTCGACDNFSDLDACGSLYMNGEDYVFAYTPAANEVIDLALTGTLTWTGLFVLDACPSTVGANCIVNATNSAGNPSMAGVSLTGGQTYYIVVSTWPTPDCTPFTIDITYPPATCSDGIQNQGETGVDCGGPCPPCGVGGCSNCGNPTVIASLPLNVANTTCGACSDFSDLDACGSLYMNGEDYIYSYTPAVAEQINLTLTGTSTYTGLFVTAGCPTAGGVCVGSSTSAAGNPILSNVSLLAGQTYYIVISTWPSPACTPFNLAISYVVPTCADGIQNQGETGVDCGGPCPACTGAATASDCSAAVNICTNSSFAVDPSGFGTVDELSGNAVSNPTINPNATPGNSGCLLSGELNSTWMIVNIASTGTLEFTLGAYDPIASNCYDWIMWAYNPTTCSDILNNIQAPLSCNWNGLCQSFTGMSNVLPLNGDASNFESGLNVTCGEQYLICFSNYSSALTSVPFNFTGTATVSCSFFNPITVNSETICQGECTALTATGGISYTWAASPDLSATNVPNVNACPISVGAHVYSVTGTGACGVGTTTSTVTVLATTDPVCTIVLETEMLDFQAYLNADKEVDLAWKTVSETNNDYFTIQKSKDGVLFVDVVEVDGAGNSTSPLLYTRKDESPYYGVSYYRLKQTDFDGSFSYSNIVSIENTAHLNGLTIHPNPASTEFTITGDYIKGAKVTLINNLGTAVNVPISRNSHSVVVNTSDVVPGLYLVIIRIDGISKTRKIIIQE